MKKYCALLLALTLAFTAGVCLAADGDKYNDGSWRITTGDDLLPVTTSNSDIGSTSYYVEDIYAETVNLSTPLVGTVHFPAASFIIATASTVAPLTTSTAPGLEIDNLLPSIVWADGEVATPACVTFRVPADYLSGGALRLFCDSSDSTTPVKVDFDVVVNKTAQVWDTAVTDQTPVALAQAAGTPEVVTLSIATDFASLVAGDVINLRVWRDDATNGTGDLELYYAEFYYNRK